MQTTTTIAELMDAASKAKTAAEYGELIENLEIHIRGHRDLIDSLKVKQQDAAFEGKGDLAKISKEIMTADSQLTTLETILEGAEKRQKAALAAEYKESTDELAKQADETAKALEQSWTKFMAVLAEARKIHAEVDQNTSKLDRLNDTLVARGKSHAELTRSFDVKRKVVGEGLQGTYQLTRDGRTIDDMLAVLGSTRRNRYLRPQRIAFAGGEVVQEL